MPPFLPPGGELSTPSMPPFPHKEAPERALLTGTTPTEAPESLINGEYHPERLPRALLTGITPGEAPESLINVFNVPERLPRASFNVFNVPERLKTPRNREN